jgi:ATP-dependent DNA helicase RecG
MTPAEQLLALCASGEGETLEFKRSTGECRDGVRALSAMLNQRGGRLLFGVDPDGKAVGQNVSDRTLEDLSQEIQRIDPPVFPSVECWPAPNGLTVIAVTAAAGAAKPYSHRGQAYQRVGNTNLTLSRDEYNRLLMERLHGERRWESEVAAGWTVADIDQEELVRVVDEAVRRQRVDEPGTRDAALLLQGLGLMRDGALLRAAAVLFGRSERVEPRLPQCTLRVARFRGTDRTEFLDNRQFHGHAFGLMRQAERFLRETLPVAGRVLPGLFDRVDDPLYPPLALREALANAFCHRDYSIGGGSVAVAVYDDRLEVTSSGDLHFGLTADDLFRPHESLPWNPLLARVFFRSGVNESWGRGTLKMVELMQQAGLPPPEIENRAACVTVRLRPGRYQPPQRVAHDLSPTQRDVLATLEASSDGLALRELRLRLSAEVPEWQVKADLAMLKSLSLVVLHGVGRGARWHFVPRALARGAE